MNVLTFVAVIFFWSSCSIENAPHHDSSQDLNEVKAQTTVEVQQVFEVDLNQFYILGQLTYLDNEKRRLEQEIEEGNEELIPELESVQEAFNAKLQRLSEIKDLTCIILEIKRENLETQANEGDEEAAIELENLLRQMEESCPESASEYYRRATSTFNFMFIGKDDGGDGQCIPLGEDCPDVASPGELVINIEEQFEDGFEAYLKNEQGEVVSEARLMGPNPDFEGLSQVVIELEPIENGILEIRKGGGETYSGHISVR